MKPIKIHISKKDLTKIKKSSLREEQKSDGMFDGRYKTKSVRSDKEYRRKPKHNKGLTADD